MFHITRRTIVAAAIVVAAIITITPPAFSQEPSGEVLKQLEKKETIPQPGEPAKPPIIQQQQPIPAEKAEQGQKIQVKDFKIQGATLVDAAAINTILAPYRDKDLTLAEITKAADVITAAYRQAGFLAAYAYIPAQDIKDGIVVIQIIEGKISHITITGNKNYTTQFIQGHLDKTKQQPTIKEQTLERALMLLNDYPFLNVHASLKPGLEPGTTDVAVTAADSYPISATLNYDNFGTKTLSKHRLSLYINKGNTITDGDSINLSGTTGLDRIDLDKLSYGRIDYNLPLDYNGTKLGIYYANSLYEAGKDLTPLKINGKADVAGIYITNPIIKKTDSALTLKLAFDYKDIYDYMLDSIRSQDKIREISLGLNYDTTDNLLFNQRARNVIGLAYYRGIQNIT